MKIFKPSFVWNPTSMGCTPSFSDNRSISVWSSADLSSKARPVFIKDSPVYQFFYADFRAIRTQDHVLNGAGRRRLAIIWLHWPFYDLPARGQWLSGYHVSVVVSPNRFWR